MREYYRTMRTLLCSLVVFAGAIALPASAQDLVPHSATGIRSGAPAAPRPTHETVVPPAAVPGAVARPGSVAPAAPGAADLPPTEALFDAINRGDIVTARDAISRGADLDGTNLLGLTPLELSVDLGRNDISFLLLSLRGGPDGSGASPPNQTAAAPPLTPAQRRQAAAEARAQAGAQARTQAVTARASRASPPPRGPALFAGNGGTAVPAAGFLGFDPHH